MSRVYDRIGCWAFAQEAANRLNVRVQWAVGKPCTDGFTVHLPDPGPGVLDEDDFLGWCATCWHELAHVRIGTFDRMKAHVAGEARRGVPESLAAFSYNVVADIADEATLPKMEAYLDPDARRRIEHLFAHSNSRAIVRHSCHGALAPRPSPTRHEIAVASGLGALMKSCPVSFTSRRTACAHVAAWRTEWEQLHGAPLWQATKAVRPARLGILARALAKGRGPGKWASLAKQARDLAEILRPYWDPAQDCPSFVSWPAARPAQPGETPEAEAVAVAVGTGAQIVARPKDPDPTTPDEADEIQSRMERMLAPIVQRLAQSDDGGTERGLQTGRLRQAWRAPVDGRPFSAATVDRRRENCSIAVLLDRSGSMKRVWKATAAIAEGFAAAMSKVGAVHRIAFGENSEACGNLRRTAVGPNNTLMAEALGLADAFLSGVKGRRFVVVVTDGVSSLPELCVGACRRLQRSGATVLGIAWRCPADQIRQTLPGATVVSCDDERTLAAWLGRVAQSVEAAS